jgi:hypothetical protein
MADGHAIVFVHLGRALPPWLPRAMFQARIFNSCPIYLAAEAAALGSAAGLCGVTLLALEDLGHGEKQKAFGEVSFFDRTFREGFWTYTTERFFVLERVMKSLGLTRIVHLENDVLLYADLGALVPKLASLYPRLAAPFDHDWRCVPGFFYAGSPGALSKLTAFILAAATTLKNLPAEQLRDVSDMMLLADFSHRSGDGCGRLPVVPPDYPGPLRNALGESAANPAAYWQNFDQLGMVFDAAAIGQYLGGLPAYSRPGPTRGFINEGAVYDARLLRPRMMVDENGLRRPLIETASGVHPVASLHVHSKELEEFLSRPSG